MVCNFNELNCKSKGYPGSDPNATPYIWFPPASDKNKVPETLPAWWVDRKDQRKTAGIPRWKTGTL